MTYTVHAPFKTSSGLTVQAGTQIELSEEQASRLKSFVRPLPDPATTYEQSSDPVSCPYWFRVCWAVQLYQRRCTRDTGCITFKFLKRQDEEAAPEIVKEREAATEAVKRHLQGGNEMLRPYP